QVGQDELGGLGSGGHHGTISWHSSTSTPPALLRCTKQTSLLSAPRLGSSFSSWKPSARSRALSARMSATSKAMWWMPSPRFSMALAMGPSGRVLSNSSILLGPVRKNAVITPSLSPASRLYGAVPSRRVYSSSAAWRSFTAIPMCSMRNRWSMRGGMSSLADEQWSGHQRKDPPVGEGLFEAWGVHFLNVSPVLLS